MTYYFDNSGTSTGPLSKEELKGKISKDTLVWYEGQPDWVKASDVEDLRDLFFEAPPPLPKKEKVIKVEASIKKEKKEILTEKNQTTIATEIKILFFIAIGALVIGLVTYLVKQSSLDYSKYSSLSNGLKSYETDYSNMLNMPYSIIDETGKQIIENWHKNNQSRLGSLLDLSRSYGCYDNSSYWSYDKREVIQNCLKYRMQDINEESFSFGKKWFFLSLLILVAGRYIFYASKWVATKSK